MQPPNEPSKSPDESSKSPDESSKSPDESSESPDDSALSGDSKTPSDSKLPDDSESPNEFSNSLPHQDEAKQLNAMLRSRTSVRAFLPDPLSAEEIYTLFSMAQRAPSWCNIQPWRLTLTQPPATDAIRQELLTYAKANKANPDIEFPSTYPEPYRDRRKECGVALYGAMDITREDKAGRYDAWLRNYAIFDAPHLLVVSCDTRLGEYGTLDVGVWLGTFLVAAESLGIQTCAMASIAAYPDLLRETLNIPSQESILLGVALGRADITNKVNQVRTTRQETAINLRVCNSINPPSQQD